MLQTYAVYGVKVNLKRKSWPAAPGGVLGFLKVRVYNVYKNTKKM